MVKIELILSHAALLGELAKWSYTVGENIGDDQVKRRHFVQGATDDGHRDLLMSAADSAWSELLRVLSAYTVDGSCGCEGCVAYRCGCGDGLGSDRVNSEEGFGGEMCEDYRVTLFFPDNTYPTLASNIGRLSKQYLLSHMQAEWERLTGQRNESTLQQAELTLRRLIAQINVRTTAGKMKGNWRYGY